MASIHYKVGDWITYPTLAPLNFDNRSIISPHTLFDMGLLSHDGIKVNQCQKRDPRSIYRTSMEVVDRFGSCRKWNGIHYLLFHINAITLVYIPSDILWKWSQPIKEYIIWVTSSRTGWSRSGVTRGTRLKMGSVEIESSRVVRKLPSGIRTEKLPTEFQI